MHWRDRLLGVLAVASLLCLGAPSQDPRDAPVSATLMVQGDAREKPGNIPFKQCFYINLDQRKDRQQRMDSALRLFTTNYRRVSAVKLQSVVDTPSDPRAAVLYNSFLRDKEWDKSTANLPNNTRNFIASVFLSHLSILRTVEEQKQSMSDAELDSMFLILEDDAKFSPGWTQAFAEIAAKELPSDWDLVRLGTWGNVRKEDKVSEHIARATAPFKDSGKFYYAGMHAVVVRPRTVSKVIKFLEATPLTDIDEMVTACCGKLHSYMVTDSLVTLVDPISRDSDHPVGV